MTALQQIRAALEFVRNELGPAMPEGSENETWEDAASRKCRDALLALSALEAAAHPPSLVEAAVAPMTKKRAAAAESRRCKCVYGGGPKPTIRGTGGDFARVLLLLRRIAKRPCLRGQKHGDVDECWKALSHRDKETWCDRCIALAAWKEHESLAPAPGP